MIQNKIVFDKLLLLNQNFTIIQAKLFKTLGF